MKNYILFTLIGSFTANTCIYSQDSTKHIRKLSIGFSIGTNAPHARYAQSDSVAVPFISNVNDMNNINGYAKNGFHFNIYSTYMITQQFGAMLSIGGNFNSFDILTLNIQAYDQYAGNFFTSTPPPSFTISGSYYVGEYLIGPYFKFHIGPPNLSLELKVLLGVVTANYPTLTYSYDYMGTIATQTETVKVGNGFGYNISGGYMYTILKGLIGLHLDVGYTGADINYPSYTTSSNGISTAYDSPKSMSLGILQFTLGGSIEL